jgi:hypothetical protein
MFDWFKNSFSRREYTTWKDVPDWNKVNDDMSKVGNDMSKVIPFPEIKAAPPPMPEVTQPGKIFYRLGLTDNNRVALSIGIMEITMSKVGVEHMIQQLQVFRDQLEDEQDEE